MAGMAGVLAGGGAAVKYPAAQTTVWDWLLLAVMLATGAALAIGVVWLVGWFVVRVLKG